MALNQEIAIHWDWITPNRQIRRHAQMLIATTCLSGLLRQIKEESGEHLEARIVTGVATQPSYNFAEPVGSIFFLEYGIVDCRWPHVRMAVSACATNRALPYLLMLVRAEVQSEGSLSERRALGKAAQSNMLAWCTDDQKRIGSLVAHVPLPAKRSVDDEMSWMFLGAEL
jgi:hypothetical protein